MAQTFAPGPEVGAPVASVPRSRSAPTPAAQDGRILRHLTGRRVDAVVLTLLLTLAVIVHGHGMYTHPDPVDDEGTYVAQAWALLHLGSLSTYTYWYDHPPLGWMQIALYAGGTGAFGRHTAAVDAGREFMLVVQAVSVALLWTLARRLRLPRWSAALAVLAFSCSPLAVTFHRQVYLDNLATAWVLAACVLAVSPRRHMGAFAMSSLCLAVAVLTKETSLLALPVVAMLLWRSSGRGTRRYVLATAGSVFVLAVSFYPLYALIKGELLPGRGHTSLLGALAFQLFQRTSGGGIRESGSLVRRTLDVWSGLDPVLFWAVVVTTLPALALRRTRPFAVGLAVLALGVVRPGYLPMPFVVVMIPLGCLVVAGLLAEAAGHRPAWGVRLRARTAAGVPILRAGAAVVAAPLAVLVVVVTGAAAALAASRWTPSLQALSTSRPEPAMRQATQWIVQNVPHGQPIIVDNAMWVDLVQAGFARRDVVWFYKPDTDGSVRPGWPSYGWVVSTPTIRNYPDPLPTVSGALRHSDIVATFGQGADRVEVRRTDAWRGRLSGPGAASADSAADAERAGADLLANPRLTFGPPARRSLQAGRVDVRMLSLLAVLSTRHRLVVSYFPSDAPPGAPARPTGSVILSSVDGHGAADDATRASLRDVLAVQDQPFQPVERVVTFADRPALQLTLPPLS